MFFEHDSINGTLPGYIGTEDAENFIDRTLAGYCGAIAQHNVQTTVDMLCGRATKEDLNLIMEAAIEACVQACTEKIVETNAVQGVFTITESEDQWPGDSGQSSNGLM